MQQTMEILSLAPTRTDPAAGNRQKPRTRQESSGFNQTFEQELGRSETRRANVGRRATNPFEPIENAKQNRIEEDEDLDGILQAAGVMANRQNEVIFILEGNMESAPEYNLPTVEEIMPQGATQIINPEENRPPDANEIPQDFMKTLDEKIAAAASNQTDPIKVAESQSAETTTTTQTGAVNVETNQLSTEQKLDTNPITASDVEARMPEVTQDSQKDTGNMSNFSENDNLSPLENENDTNRINEQSGKTYSEAESTASETKTTEAPPLTTETLPPLADGIRPEQFRGVEQMKEATLSQPVKPENLFQELVQRVELMQNVTRSAMTLTLNPEHLGSVALEVAIDAAGLHVKINAEDSGVRGMINAQIAALIEALEEKGHQVAEVEVAYTGMEYNHSMFKEDPKGNQSKSDSHRGGKNGEADKKEAVTYYTTLPDIMDYYMDTGVSSVEFSA